MARKEYEININGDTRATYWLYDNVVTPIITVDAVGNVVLDLEPGKFYKFGTINSLTLTLSEPEPCADGTIPLTEYSGKFTTSSSWGGDGLNVPVTIVEASGNDAIEIQSTYEFSIIDNVLIIRDITPRT